MSKKENTEKWNKTELALELILGLMLLLLPDLIPEKVLPYLNQFGEFVGYKWLLQLILFLLLVITFQRYWFQKKALNKTPAKEIKQIPEYPSKEETKKKTINILPYNGVHFRYDTVTGETHFVPYCPIHKTPMQELYVPQHYKYEVAYKCHTCGEGLRMNKTDYRKNYEAFCDLVKSHIEGLLDEIPTESKKP